MAKSDSTLPKGLYLRHGIYHASVQVNGKSVRKSLRTKDFNDALNRLNDIRSRLERNYIDHQWVKDKRQNRDWVRTLHTSAKTRTEKKGLEFDITYEHVKNLADQSGMRCAITGIPFSWDKPESCRVAPFIPSLDRIDCSKGYVNGNIRIVCWAANIAMSDWGEEVFTKVAKALVAKLLTEN